jgi:hypothetical protein
MRTEGAGLVRRHFMILLVGSSWGLCRNYKIFAFGTFLDIEGAFDNASFNLMVMASLDHGVDGSSTKWIDSMLKNRTTLKEKIGNIYQS